MPVLTRARAYRGPQRAAVAMMLQRLGATPDGQYPTIEHVNALAHHNPDTRGDLGSLWGVALSFSDIRRVRIFGQLRGDGSPPEAYRRDILLERRHVEYTETSLTAEELIGWLEASENWIVKLDLPGAAVFPDGAPAYQPCLVVGHQEDRIILHNPGTNRLRAVAHQAIGVAQALGGPEASSQRDGVSLLAVSP